MLFRIKSSPLQSAPIRFSASLFSAKQGGSNPLLLVSGRFRLCSALPYQILESHLQALPWLLFAFLAGPFRFASSPFRSLPCRFKSWPSYAIPHPVRALRLAPPPCFSAALRFHSVLFSAFPWRITSYLRYTISVRILAPPLASFPILLVPAPVPASTYLRHATLGESVLSSAIALHLLSRRN